MYIHMCTHTHTHTDSVRSVTGGWILQGPSAGIALSQSHLFCFPMGGSVRRDKHGRGVLATADPPRESGGGCAGQAGFGLSAGGGAKANSAGPAGTRPARAQATLPWWHCQHLGRPADPRRHLRHGLDPFLWSHPSHSCTNLMRNPRFRHENTQLCPASLCPSHALRPCSREHRGTRWQQE